MQDVPISNCLPLSFFPLLALNADEMSVLGSRGRGLSLIKMSYFPLLYGAVIARIDAVK